jgi:hypothetical protein
MAATDNKLRLPNEHREKAERFAERQGRSADDVAAEALQMYLEAQRDVEELNALASWGESDARERGFKPADVDRAISDIRLAR